MKPLREIDGYSFNWPHLSSPTAKHRVETLIDHMIELTPRERVAFLDKWIPALSDAKAAEKAGIGAIDRHLVITALTTWREDNRERCAA